MPIEKSEEIINSYKDIPPIQYIHHKAYYNTIEDIINMPKIETFDSNEEYYSTLFHECVHSTGHKRRLSRSTITDREFLEQHQYTKEELIAEMGSAYLCAHSGIEQKVIENSAAYIQSWLSKLHHCKDLFIHCASKAQKATDYILGMRFNDLGEISK